MEKKNTWETYDEATMAKVDSFIDGYRKFLDDGKTERECIDVIVNTIEDAGYISLEQAIKNGKKLT